MFWIKDYKKCRVYILQIHLILEKSSKYNIKGNLDLPFYPAYDEESQTTPNITVDYQDEFDELASTTGNFGSINLTGFLAGALTKISRS